MIQEPQKFSIVDPRTMMGDAYQVAGRSLRQVAAVLAVLEGQREPVNLMARNAFMERELELTGAAKAEEWPDTPHYRMLADIFDELASLRGRLGVLATALEFDPRKAEV